MCLWYVVEILCLYFLSQLTRTHVNCVSIVCIIRMMCYVYACVCGVRSNNSNNDSSGNRIRRRKKENENREEIREQDTQNKRQSKRE